LTYAADSAQSIELNLSGTKDYTLEVIDTWNMTVDSAKVVKPGKFLFETEIPFTALRLIAN
jgi:hypothetical protein